MQDGLDVGLALRLALVAVFAFVAERLQFLEVFSTSLFH
jgi:hypothetical protein